MGLLGSTLGRSLAGAAQGASLVLNKYIDRDLELQKAQAIEDMRLASAGKLREQDDSFKNDPTRVARDRDNKVADIKAEGGARNTTALEGAIAEASNTQLTDARVARENAVVGGTEATRTAAEVARASALLPLEVKKAYAVADASASATAKYREARVQPGDELKAKIKATEDLLGRSLTEPEKLGIVGLAKGRDPELDTQTVVEEKMNSDGTMTKTTRKEVRRAGQGGQPTPDDPIKAAMDAARAAKDKKGDGGAKPGADRSLLDRTTDRAPVRAAAPDSAEATAFDSAKREAETARAVLLRYGSRQRQEDPAGYQRAQQAAEAARAAEKAAQTAYERTVGAVGASFRMSSP